MLEKMDIFFQNRLSGYDEHMLTTIEGADKFYPFTAKQLPMKQNAEVLDLGCGTGLELEAYFRLNPHASVTGIDLSQAMLSALSSKFPDRKMHLICASYFDAELGTNTYDAAVSVESLHHFPAKQKLPLYQRLARSLKKGGYFILTDYFAESEELEREYFSNLEQLKRKQGIHDDAFYHYDTPLTVEHEMEVLRKAGFTKVCILNQWGATCTVKATC